MPANIVRPGQEKYWERAKARAAEEGHAEDWPYITAIFKKMTLNKAFVIFHRMAEGVTPGQVPDPRLHEGYRMMTAKPRMVTERMLLDPGPTRTAREAVSGLGMTAEDERAWEQFILEQEGKGEFVMRQEFMQAAREQELDPHLKLALFRRIQRYLEDTKPKPPTPVEVLRGEPMSKSGTGPRGGRYYARAQLPGGKYRYFYDEDSYRAYKGGDVRGHEAAADRAHHAVHAHIQKFGDQGVSHQELLELAQKHGPRQVAQALRAHLDAGTLHHSNGRIYSGGVTHEKPRANGRA